MFECLFGCFRYKGITQVSESRFELRATTVPVPSRAHETSWQKLPPAPGCGSPPPTAATVGGFKGLAQAEQPAAEKTIGSGGGGGGGEGGVAALASVPPWAYWSHCGGAASCPTYPRHEPTEGELAIFLLFYFSFLFSFHFLLVLFHFMFVFVFLEYISLLGFRCVQGRRSFCCLRRAARASTTSG